MHHLSAWRATARSWPKPTVILWNLRALSVAKRMLPLVANMPDGALVQALELSYRKEITKDQAKKLGESPRPEQADPLRS